LDLALDGEIKILNVVVQKKLVDPSAAGPPTSES